MHQLLAFTGLALPLGVKAAILIATYAMFDRYVGGGAPNIDAKIPGRSVAHAGLAGAGLGWLLAGPVLAVSALLWAGYRSLPFGGTTTPVNAGQYVRCALRHAVVGVPMVFVAVGFGLSPFMTAAAFILYVGAAVSLAAAYGNANLEQQNLAAAGRELTRTDADMQRLNRNVELARGGCFGLALTFAFLVSAAL